MPPPKFRLSITLFDNYKYIIHIIHILYIIKYFIFAVLFDFFNRSDPIHS